MAPGPRARRPRPGVERPRGPPHGQSLPVTIPPDPDTAGLPAPAQEGFPQVRWAPATPPTTLRATPRGPAAHAFQDETSGAGPGVRTLARVRETGERRGSPRPAGPGPDHSLWSLRAPSPAPSREQKLPLPLPSPSPRPSQSARLGSPAGAAQQPLTCKICFFLSKSCKRVL